MKKIRFVSAVLFSLMIFAAPFYGQATMNLECEIISVDPESKVMEVRNALGNLTVQASPDVVVLKDGSVFAFEDLGAGELITVALESGDGKAADWKTEKILIGIGHKQ